MTAPARVEVFVLGPLLVQCDGRPVELGPVRRRATLAALAVDTDRVVPLDTLLDRVWDGAPPKAAVNAVQAYLSRLRSALVRAGAGDGAASPIVTEHPGYRLAIGPAALDASRFAEAVTAARAARDAGDLAAASRTVRAGLALWRGEAYLDVPTAVARAESDRLSGLRATARHLAVELDLGLGRHDDVLDELRELTTAAPLAEPLHALRMLALYRAGRPAEALDHFTRVRRTLGDELGVDPGRELQDLHARMLREDPTLLPVPTTTTSAAPDPVAPVAAVPASLDTTADAPRLIGRVAEARALRQALTTAAATGARTVTVVGEAGIGKTRLLEEGAAHARSAGAVVAWGRSWQHDGAPRMWPFAQALRALADQLDPGDFAAAVTPHADALAAIVPDLVGDRTPRLDVGVDLDGSELRLLDAVTQVLTGLGARRPLVLLLEDMHWADVTSRRTAEYLSTHLDAPGVALVLSVRWPSDEASAVTAALLAALARAGRQVRIDLGGFDADDIRAYVADRTGSDLDDATTAALLERTDGNPFFVGEIVRLVVTDAGAVRADDAVPESVRAVVLARLDRIDRADRSVLDAAAVVGRSFDLDLLVTASGESEAVVDEAVDRATAAGVVGTEPGHPGVHRFGHALVQQTLLDALGPARRRRIHARLAAALRARVGSDGTLRDVDQVVHHLAGAGGDAALVEAVALSTEAAEQARRRGDWAQTETLLLRAVDLSARIAGPEAAAAELSARLGLFSLYTLDSPTGSRAEQQRTRVVDLARQIGDARAIVVALAGMSAYWSTLGLLDRMEENAAEIGKFADQLDDDVLRIARLAAVAQTRLQRGRAAAGITAAETALELLARPEVKVPFDAFPLEPRWNLRFWRMFGAWLLGREDEVAAQRSELTRGLADADAHTRLYVHTMLLELDAWNDDPEGGAVEAAATRAAQREAGLVGQALLWIDPVDAWVRERLEPGSAIDELDAAVKATDVMPTMAQRPYLRVMHAESLLRLGRVAEARAAVDAGLAEVAVTGERSMEPALWGASSHVAAAVGDDVTAAAHRDRGRAVAAELGIHWRDRAR